MNAFDALSSMLPEGLRLLMAPPYERSDQTQRLAAILNVDIRDLAAIRMGPRFHYRPFAIAKPDGRERRLLAPSPALKTMQRRLLDNYLNQFPVHGSATAFHRGSSIVHNAQRHARQNLVATVDLRDFFETTSAVRVRAFFVKHGWRDEALKVLMRLCVYRNGLPQGAPTSPCLSNLVNIPLDDRLSRLAQQSGATYTRYGDDLAFSWASDSMPNGFQQAVEDGLHAAGYEIQRRKGWLVCPISARPRVTGVILIGKGRLTIPWALRWRIWCLRWRLLWRKDNSMLAKLRGYEGYARMVK